MSNVYYMLTFTIVFALVVLLVFTIRSFIVPHSNYHWISFVWIDKDFDIQTLSNLDYDAENTIFVDEIPDACEEDSNQSIYCLSELKEMWWFYSGRWYKWERVD